MKLLLTSGGLMNKSIVAALQDLAPKPLKELKLVFIPTAANVEKGDKWWLIDDLNNCQKTGFSAIDIVDFTAVPKDVWLPRLQDADIYLFGGGNTFHLAHSLQKSGLDKLLPELLKTRIYMGISAGSVITGKNITLSDSVRLYSEDIGNVDAMHGLGFVDFQIRPHLDSEHFPQMNSNVLKEVTKDIPDTVYAIDDQSAIKIDGDDMTIISEGKWEKFN
jgi:dipeptidase E